MGEKELIREMYNFAKELALDLKEDKFTTHREKWNKLMSECEQKLNKNRWK